jgi:hypothetical protein
MPTLLEFHGLVNFLKCVSTAQMKEVYDRSMYGIQFRGDDRLYGI